MGAGISCAIDDATQDAGLGELPESCVASVLLHLSPPEICHLATVSRTFGSAATADCVWDLKLPRNYKYLVEKGGNFQKFDSKKEIYAQLCRWNVFDNRNKAFWLEKKSGGVCMSICYKALAITGIDDRRYWNRISTDESSWVELLMQTKLHVFTSPKAEILFSSSGSNLFQFQTVAYLQQVWWLEVGGEVDFIFPAGSYSLYFHLHLGRPSKRLGRRTFNTKHVHGWDKKPVKFQLWTSDGQHSISECHLDEPGCWTRYHVGDFVVRKSDVPTKVKFSMTQIDCTHTKGGLCVDSVLIYPKGFR